MTENQTKSTQVIQQLEQELARTQDSSPYNSPSCGVNEKLELQHSANGEFVVTRSWRNPSQGICGEQWREQRYSGRLTNQAGQLKVDLNLNPSIPVKQIVIAGLVIWLACCAMSGGLRDPLTWLKFSAIPATLGLSSFAVQKITQDYNQWFIDLVQRALKTPIQRRAAPTVQELLNESDNEFFE